MILEGIEFSLLINNKDIKVKIDKMNINPKEIAVVFGDNFKLKNIKTSPETINTLTEVSEDSIFVVPVMVFVNKIEEVFNNMDYDTSIKKITIEERGYKIVLHIKINDPNGLLDIMDHKEKNEVFEWLMDIWNACLNKKIYPPEEYSVLTDVVSNNDKFDIEEDGLIMFEFPKEE